MSVKLTSLATTLEFAEALGSVLVGGEVLELTGDVGSGKTSFTKGLARGLGVIDDVQSPSFTISRVYDGRNGLKLAHYDFYRLSDPGIMAYDILEASSDDRTIVVVEWAQTISDVLPENRTIISFSYGQAEDEREVTIQSKVIRIGELYAAWNQD